MTDPANLAHADQLAAAALAAHQSLVERFAGSPHADVSQIPGPPAWVQPFVARHNQLVDEPHPQCVHIGDNPTVLHIAVWCPGVVCCGDCADAGLLAAHVPPGESHRCDVCNTDQADGPLFSGWFRAGHVIIHFAVCPTCDPAGQP